MKYKKIHPTIQLSRIVTKPTQLKYRYSFCKENIVTNNQKLETKKGVFLIEKRLFKQWAMMGSNHRPKDYESYRLSVCFMAKITVSVQQCPKIHNNFYTATW
ncbi:hypothetical protein EZ444_17050 [Pedobacter hiemivivus]|uniref:Uncharacterized protein n=1 Tax=Pedobacter hiemivivus TaxID=2530454 RepID=A0A4R0N8Z0_9SPHI|nr:hypothetical protein EZ444_17050 [Pedobacter hiemivivus]